MDKKDIHYIYAYLDPRKPGNFVYGNYFFNFEPFYIGKGKGDRYLSFTNRNKHFVAIINKIKERGKEPIVIFLNKIINEKDAYDLEIVLISLIGRKDKNNGPLSNMTNGGEGVDAGGKLTEENKRKISASGKGRIPWNAGGKLSEEHKRKIGRPGKSNFFFGKKHTGASILKMSKGIKLAQKIKGHPRQGAILSDETKKKISRSRIGFNHSEKTKQKMRQSAKYRPKESEETRKKRSESLTLWWEIRKKEQHA